MYARVRERNSDTPKSPFNPFPVEVMAQRQAQHLTHSYEPIHFALPDL